MCWEPPYEMWYNCKRARMLELDGSLEHSVHGLPWWTFSQCEDNESSKNKEVTILKNRI